MSRMQVLLLAAAFTLVSVGLGDAHAAAQPRRLLRRGTEAELVVVEPQRADAAPARRLQEDPDDVEWLADRIEAGRGAYWPVREDCLEVEFIEHGILALESDGDGGATATIRARGVPSGVDERYRFVYHGPTQIRFKLYRVNEPPSSETADDGDYTDLEVEPQYYTGEYGNDGDESWWYRVTATVDGLEQDQEYAYQFFTECVCDDHEPVEEDGPDPCSMDGEDHYLFRVGPNNKGIHFVTPQDDSDD